MTRWRPWRHRCLGVSAGVLSPRRQSEAGTGLFSIVVGVLVFLILLLLAVQVAFALYARSAVGAAAFDAARVVAGSDAGATAAAQADAESNARSELGRYGSDATFVWGISTDQVRLTVTAENPNLLPAFVSAPLGLDRITREVVVTRERVH